LDHHESKHLVVPVLRLERVESPGEVARQVRRTMLGMADRPSERLVVRGLPGANSHKRVRRGPPHRGEDLDTFLVRPVAHLHPITFGQVPRDETGQRGWTRDDRGRRAVDRRVELGRVHREQHLAGEVLHTHERSIEVLAVADPGSGLLQGSRQEHGCGIGGTVDAVRENIRLKRVLSRQHGQFVQQRSPRP